MASDSDYAPPAKAGSYTSRAQKPISIVEVGNQILAPLLVGLEMTIEKSPRSLVGAFGKPHTRIPLGTNIRYTRSFTVPGKKHAPPDPDDEGIFDDDDAPPPSITISPYTEALAILHDQLLAVSRHMGMLIDRKSLPAGIGDDLLKHAHNDPEAVKAALTPENLPKLHLVFNVPGHDKPIEIDVPNIPIGPKKKSLAHVMLALELASDTVKGRTGVVARFMLDATGGFIETLPPLQMAIQRHLSDELRKNGYDGDKILQLAECDLDRREVKRAFDILQPYAELYEMSCELRGDHKPDYLQKAFRQMRKFCSAPAQESACRDGHEYALLLEGMIDHVINNGNAQERQDMQALKDSFTEKVGNMLRVQSVSRPLALGYDLPPPPTVSEILALPQAQKIIEVFSEYYAKDFLLDKHDAVTQRAWDKRLQSEKPWTGPGKL